jgi:hypothetical protein
MGNKNAQRVMIMGDFNYPAIDFGECKVNAGEGSEDYKFYSRLQKLFLVQNVTEPTRVRGGQESSVLDYIITDEDNLVDDLNYEVPMGKSDHVCLTWRLGLEREELQQGPQEKFDYYRGNYEEISAALRAVDWDGRMGDGEDLEKMWACFREMVTEVVNKWVPKRKIKRKTNRKVNWMTKETKKRIKQRNKLWRVQKNYSSDINYGRYKKVRNEVTELVRRDQDNYRKRLLKSFKGHDKRFYGYIRSLQTRPAGVQQLVDGNGKITETDGEAAELLSKCFQEVYTQEDKKEE